MFTILMVSLSVVTVIAYCTRIFSYAAALPATVNDAGPDLEIAKMRISVVIPVRDEREYLGRLLNDLSSIDYPKQLYDVIFINDHSGDGSEQLLREAAERELQYHFLELPPKVTGKKQAIAAGVDHSSSDWIIQVDADCTFSPGLLREHAARAAEGDVVLIAGPVIQMGGRGAWSKLAALDFMSLAAAGMASFFVGKPIMCNGANLSYSRGFYLSVEQGLLEIPSVSGDDVFILQAAVNQGRGVVCLESPEAMVETEAPGRVADFFRQRTRWASKTPYSKDSELVLVAGLVWLSNAVMAGLLIMSFINPAWFLLFVPLWLIKAGADYYLLFRYATMFHRTRLLQWFLPAALFYYFYIVVAGLLSILGTISWKGRKYSAL